MLSPRGNTTGYGYDHLGRQITATLPTVQLYDGSSAAPTSSVAYDVNGNVVRRIDGAGDASARSWDPLSRLISSTDPISGTTIMTYTVTRLAQTRDPQGNVNASTYDCAGRLQTTVDGSGLLTTYGYDNAGNATSQSAGPVGMPEVTTASSYGALNRPGVVATSGIGIATQAITTSYDLNGNMVRVEEPTGHTTFTGYDLADEALTKEMDPNAPTLPVGAASIVSTYDLAAVPASLTTANGNVRRTVDGSNELLLLSAPSLNNIYSYDLDGNRLEGRSIYYSPNRQSYTIADESYTYNATGWRTGTDTSFALTTQINSADLPTTSGYDAAERLRQLTVGAPQPPLAGPTQPLLFTYNLDPRGLLTAVGDGMGSTSFAYTANKLVSGTTLPTGVREHRTYDGATRMAHLDVAGPTSGAAPLASSYDYGYDPAGLTAAITGTLNGVAAAQELSHDARGYLTAAGGSSVSNWSYNQSGNLLTARSGSTNYTYGYVAGWGQVQPGPNQLVTLLVPFPFGGSQEIRTYHYNANGDVSEIDPSGSALYLNYDSFSRLFDITRGGTTPGAVASMRYDAAGHHADYQAPVPATRTSPGGTKETLFSYTGDKVAQTVTSDTTAPTIFDRYSYRPVGSPLELLRTLGGVTTRYFYVVEGRRNVVALTDVGGNVVDRYSYGAWGVQLSVSEQVPQQLRYQGYWYDNQVGWYWLGTRYYDPTLGRFLQSDRSGKEGVYSYTYCNNDPVDCTDPQGSAGTSGAVLFSPQSQARCSVWQCRRAPIKEIRPNLECWEVKKSADVRRTPRSVEGGHRRRGSHLPGRWTL